MAIAVLGLVALVGCGNESAAPKTVEYHAKKSAHLAKGKVAADELARKKAESNGGAALGTSSMARSYAYDPTGKRDPFRSYVLRRKREQVADEGGPLGQFDLNQLKVVAVVWSTDHPRALVRDPAGRAYMIGEGSRIGKNRGRVVRIHDNLVLVTETYTDYLGDSTSKDIGMRIHRNRK